MFKKNRAAINPSDTDTLIGEGSTFEGNIKTKASIRIEGAIIGDVEASGDVVIGEGGNARSNITAHDLILAGTLTGNVKVSGKLIVCATGTLIGDVYAQSFIIEAGGLFNGNSSMSAATPEIVTQKELKASS